MLIYSFALVLGLAVTAPWWLVRMATTQRYREGLRQRLGRVPAQLIAWVYGKRVVWVHAVSVGEVLAATPLVAELEAALQTHWSPPHSVILSEAWTQSHRVHAQSKDPDAAGTSTTPEPFYPPPPPWAFSPESYDHPRHNQQLRGPSTPSRIKPRDSAQDDSSVPNSKCNSPAPDWVVVVSTTTRTGQALARERFGAERVFYFPLDFVFAVRAFLRALRPEILVLMESEVWPRMLHECKRARVPVAVVNARVSDRSFARGMRVRRVWGHVLRGVSLWLAQSDEDARRLVAMGARTEIVRAIGNLKYDVRAPKTSRVAELIKEVAAGRPIVVAGSTVGGVHDKSLSEEEMVVQAWEGHLRRKLGVLLVIAPRHPERFAEAEIVAMEFHYEKASAWAAAPGKQIPYGDDNQKNCEMVVLDTIGDLAAVYGVADVAIVGGSLVKRGGHNPLEPAQFGVPVIMGPSFENFRDIVTKMKEAKAICIVDAEEQLEAALLWMLEDREAARAMGKRGQRVFEEQQGATERAVEALVAMVKP